MNRGISTVLVLAAAVTGYCVYDANRPPDYRPFTRQTFGVAFDLGTPDVEVNSPRSIHGDGYTFERYRLPDHVLQLFADSAARLERYPLVTEIRREWSCKPWTRTPAAPADSFGLQSALSEAPTAARDDAKVALNAAGNWYSTCIKGSGYRNADLYLVDVKRRQFVYANFNM